MKFTANFLWIAFLMALPVSMANAAEPFDDLFQPTDISVHPNGNLYIADSGSHRIVMLDPEGRFLGEFGRKGFAPGEFQRPCAVAFLSQDEVLVGDNIAKKIQVFSAEGEYKRLFQKGEMGAGQIWVMKNGDVLTTENDGQVFSFKIDDEKPKPLLRFSKEGESLEGFGTVYDHEIPFVAALLNHGSVAISGDRIAFARIAENILEIFGGDRAVSHRYAPAFPVRTPDGEMKQVKQADGSVSFQMVAESDAHCLDLEAIDDARLLMLRAKSAEDEGVVSTQLVVLSWKGELLKVLPGNYRAKSMALSRDGMTVYLLDENDDGWFLETVSLNL